MHYGNSSTIMDPIKDTISDPITEKGVAHAFEVWLYSLKEQNINADL